MNINYYGIHVFIIRRTLFIDPIHAHYSQLLPVWVQVEPQALWGLPDEVIHLKLLED